MSASVAQRRSKGRLSRVIAGAEPSRALNRLPHSPSLVNRRRSAMPNVPLAGLAQLAAGQVRKRAHLVGEAYRRRFAYVLFGDLIDARYTEQAHIDDKLFFEQL